MLCFLRVSSGTGRKLEHKFGNKKLTFCFEISRAETEAKELRRETLLLGEIVRKFRENASLAPQIVANENEKHLTNTYRNQVIACTLQCISRFSN